MQAFSFLTICYLSDLPRGEEKAGCARFKFSDCAD